MNFCMKNANFTHFKTYWFLGLYIFIALFIRNADAIHRQLSYNVLSSCDTVEVNATSSPNYLNLVHIKAEGPDDTVHYLWSTYHLPSIIIAKTSHKADLEIVCDKLMNFGYGSLSFSETPLYSMGFILTKFWEFIDEDDTLAMSRNKTYDHSPSDFSWDDVNDTIAFSESVISASPRSMGESNIFSKNGTIGLQFSASATEMPSNTFPHLHFNGNSSELRILLNNLNTVNKKSRFAVELVALSPIIGKQEWKTTTVTSIDDEYSPGVFSVKSLLSPCVNEDDSCKGYFSWKPVAYIGEKPTVANSSDAQSSHFRKEKVSNFGIPLSIAAAYFGNVSLVSWNMTFGTHSDGFYLKTKYTSWSFMMGLGQPVMDELSVLVIVVISVGLGAPLLIFLGGVSFLIYKRCRKDDDDLLLEG